jgi:hypothetical protein
VFQSGVDPDEWQVDRFGTITRWAEELEQAGADGWELVTLTPVTIPGVNHGANVPRGEPLLAVFRRRGLVEVIGSA